MDLIKNSRNNKELKREEVQKTIEKNSYYQFLNKSEKFKVKSLLEDLYTHEEFWKIKIDLNN